MMRKHKGYPVYPLTVAQKFHLFYLPYCPSAAVMNIGTRLTIQSEIDWDLLKQSIQGQGRHLLPVRGGQGRAGHRVCGLLPGYPGGGRQGDAGKLKVEGNIDKALKLGDLLARKRKG